MSIDVNAIEQTVEVTAVGDEINVNIIDQPVLVSVTDQIIEVEASGATGPQGPAGAGVAVGGTTGQVLSKASNTNYDTVWVDAGAGTVYSVNASGSTGISVTGGPITSTGTLTITNTAPDQVVGLTGGGTAVITGTYPNFTITTNDQFDGTVTSVNLTAGTGISVSGGPITTSGNINVVNTSPDQVVSLTSGGTTTITGTYPNFTISSADSTLGTVTSVNMTVPTGLTISGNPITSAGTLALALASGYSIPTTASQATWDSAYNDKINSAAVTGTTTKTLTLNQQDGGTVTASWTDDNTDAVTSVFGRTGAVVATGGDYTTSQVTEVTNLYYTEGRVSANSDVAANTAARHNAVTIGTANGLSLSTQALSLALASGSTTGALSSTDWSTFNSKQTALSGTGFVKISGTTISYDNSTYYLASNPSAFIALTALSGSTGISYNNTTGVITNSAPDQVVALTGAGTTTISGTYPNFTISSSDSAVGTVTSVNMSVPTGLSVSGNPITTSGTLAIALASGYVIPTQTTLDGKVPYTGATTNVDLGTFDLTADIINLNQLKAVGSGGLNIYSNSGTHIALMGGGGGAGTTFYGGIIGVSASFTSNGSSDTFGITHSSGSGIALNITKGGNGEGLYINKTSGSGNAATIIGTLNATTLVKSGGTSTQFLKADGSVDSTTYQAAITLTTTGTSGAATFSSNTLNIPDYGSALSGYLPLSGGTLTGALSGTSATFNGVISTNNDINLTSSSYVYSSAGGSGVRSGMYLSGATQEIIFITAATQRLTITSTGAATFGSSVTASSLIKSGGTSSQYLMADGSTSTLTNPVTGTGTTNYLPKWTSGSAIGNSNLINDASGNLGLGVVPSAWGSTYKVLQFPGGYVGSDSTLVIGMGQNFYWNGSANIYVNNGFAEDYYQYLGQHVWRTAPSGTAGGTITFTQAMTLSAGGDLGIANTSPSYRVDIEGSSGSISTVRVKNGNTGGSDGSQILLGNSANFTNAYFRLNGGGNTSQGGAGSLNIGLTESAAMTFLTANTERLRITSGGNVGINCTGTNAKLEVVATTGEVFRADAASGAYRIVATQTGVNMQGKLNFASLPTSASGLVAGDVWNDGGTLKIV